MAETRLDGLTRPLLREVDEPQDGCRACFAGCGSSVCKLLACFKRRRRAHAEVGAEPQARDDAASVGAHVERRATAAAKAVEARVDDEARIDARVEPAPAAQAMAEPPPDAPSDELAPSLDLPSTPDEQALVAGKYFSKRHELWSRYDEGVRMDHVGWYSVTPERIAARIAARCRGDVVLDAFAGVGGNAIQFARAGARVVAIELDAERLLLARHNARIYGVAERIDWVHGDCTALWRAVRADAVFLSPPWGGVDYRDAAINLRKLGGFDCHALVRGALAVSERIVLYLPRTTGAKQLKQLGACHARERAASLAPGESAAVDIQTEECVDAKGVVRARAVYLGFGAAASLAEGGEPPHGAAAAAGEADDAIAAGAPPPRARRRLCTGFQAGACTFGARCHFSHDAVELEARWADAVADGVRACASGRLTLVELGAQLVGQGFASSKASGGLKARLRSQHADRFAVEGDAGAESVRLLPTASSDD